MGLLMIVVALALAGVLVLFGVQNTAPITLHVLWFTLRSIPLAVAILGGAVMGALVSLAVALPGRLRHALTVRALRRQVARHEAHMARLAATTDVPDTQRSVPARRD